MFQRIIESIIKLIYARRIRNVELVGKAAQMAKEGRYQDALSHLNEIENRLHPKVRSLHAFTKARVLDDMGYENEAESAMILSAKLDPGNFRAHLEIARMCGRKFHFKNAKARFEALLEVGDNNIALESKKYLTEIEQIESGKAAKLLAKRAAEAARISIDSSKQAIGLPADITVMDQFITNSPQRASELIEDLAVLLGESAVIKGGGNWQISLFLPNSFVSFPNKEPFYPFRALALRLTGSDISILQFNHSKSK